MSVLSHNRCHLLLPQAHNSSSHAPLEVGLVARAVGRDQVRLIFSESRPQVSQQAVRDGVGIHAALKHFSNGGQAVQAPLQRSQGLLRREREELDQIASRDAHLAVAENRHPESQGAVHLFTIRQIASKVLGNLTAVNWDETCIGRGRVRLC